MVYKCTSTCIVFHKNYLETTNYSTWANIQKPYATHVTSVFDIHAILIFMYM